MNLEPDEYAEVVRRLVSLRELSDELAKAFDDEVSRAGAEEMKSSLQRVLQLLKYQEIDSASWPTTLFELRAAEPTPAIEPRAASVELHGFVTRARRVPHR
jgi:type I restriction-modification system DNA methylase subunit